MPSGGLDSLFKINADTWSISKYDISKLKNEPERSPEKIDLKPTSNGIDSGKGFYEVTDGEFAEYLGYNYRQGWLYIAHLKALEEFGSVNEGTVSIDKEKNALTFSLTKSAGTVTGAVDGPNVYFKLDLILNKIIEKSLLLLQTILSWE